MIAAGRTSNTSRMARIIVSSDTVPVPKLSTYNPTGAAFPIAYATWISSRSARPAATTFFATHRRAYAADRSTFHGSFPLNPPPPAPADFKPTGGIDKELHVGTSKLNPIEHRRYDKPSDLGPQALGRNFRRVLRRQHNRFDRARRMPLVTNRHLGFTIGSQIVEFTLFAHLCEPFGEPVRNPNRQRHELGGFSRCKAEHDALVARPLPIKHVTTRALARFKRVVNSLCNIGRLPTDRHRHSAGTTVEPDIR